MPLGTGYPLRIAVDAMGGDRGPQVVAQGVIEAARQEKDHFLLVGAPAQLEPELARAHPPPQNLEIVPASEVITMEEQPTVAFKRKPDASVCVGARLVKEKKADALVTIGNTGAAMAVSLLTLGRIKGIDRPAIAAPLPTALGTTVVLVDAGATVDCEVNNLYEFAVMGTVYAQSVLGIARPRVGLLSNGEESSKGNDLVKRAHIQFQQSLTEAATFDFIGNVEGRDVYRGEVDVVVCDGFVGNVFLKTSEGVAEMILHLLKAELSQQVWTQAFAMPLRPAFRRVRKQLDYTERGGAPLLGINGVCVIGHGRSDAHAVANACRVARRAVQFNMVEGIRQRLCEVPAPSP
jgi:glycerol-3-phosphate acyltransferase PlsX